MYGPPTPRKPIYDPRPDAEAYTRLLWNHISRFMFTWLRNHHVNHEAGGMDQVRLNVADLADVTLGGTIANNDVLKWQAAGSTWVNGTGGGGKHQVHFSVVLPATVIPPGPTNITGAALQITAVNFASDGTIAGSLSPGGSFSLVANAARTDNLAIAWADGQTMSLTITNDAGDGSYLSIDVAAG